MEKDGSGYFCGLHEMVRGNPEPLPRRESSGCHDVLRKLIRCADEQSAAKGAMSYGFEKVAMRILPTDPRADGP